MRKSVNNIGKTVRLFTRTGVGNQLQFIPVIKVLIKNGFNLYSDSKVLLSLLPDTLLSAVNYKGLIYDYGILLYHQGLPDAWQAKKVCNKLIAFPYSFKISNHREIPILSRLLLANRDTFNENEPEILNNMRLLRHFGIENAEIDYSVPISHNPEKNVIGISAGSGAHQEKRWRHFSDLINTLPGKEFRLFGTEIELNQSIQAQTYHNNARIIRTSNLREAAEEIAKCEMFVCNDNGLMHLADLLRVPTVAIFGMTNIKRNHPWNENSRSISLDLYCSPCYHNGNIKCINPKRYACMEISVNHVLQTIQELEAKI